jgi:hypothetical protein
MDDKHNNRYNKLDNKNKFKNNKNKQSKIKMVLIIEIVILCLVVGAYLYYTFSLKNNNNDKENVNEQVTENNNNSGNNGKVTPEPSLTPEEEEAIRLEEERKLMEEKINATLEEANFLALGYDYEGAIQRIKSFDGNYEEYEELTTAIANIEGIVATLDPLGAYDSIDQISHIFFHSLIADTSKAFDNDYKAKGYNYYMTTVSEFNEMMQQMYDDGYVLVSIHDVAKKITNEDGTTVYKPGDIMLPKDKKPFVLSQDDVNYYEYMTGDGFATRIVIDENGRPSTEMLLEDGTVSVGDYDMVPALETFIAEHPDFSYQGARGILALTGYEGSMGYRTNDSTSPTYEEDKEKVKEVAEVLKQWGWEFASHSYGHRNMGEATYNFTIKDTDRWMEEVGSLIGPTDIYIYPYGIEIEKNISGYSSDKYEYLKSLGFDYYCGVYKSPWIQVHSGYVRMTRRPLDGQAMLQFPERLTDLFDLSKVIDSARPAWE